MRDCLRGHQYSSERRFFNDPTTGYRITQLTDFPVANAKFYFHINQFTPDSKTLVFRSTRSMRFGMIDIFRVDTDGHNLIQLTDEDAVASPILSYSGQYLYYLRNGTLVRVDINTFEQEDVCHGQAVAKSDGCSSLTIDDRYLYAEATLNNGRMAVLRYETDGSGCDIVYESERQITHTQIEPYEGKLLAIQAHDPEYPHHNLFCMNSDGTNFHRLDLPYGNGHWMWVGDTKKLMSNRDSDHWGIVLWGEGDREPHVVAKDLHYWHASCSMDGRWMVSDTNWPDDGLRIINVVTEKVELVCRPGSTCSHPSWTHPHPSFSPDMKYVLYNSNATGVGHVYLAELPTDLLASMSR